MHKYQVFATLPIIIETTITASSPHQAKKVALEQSVTRKGLGSYDQNVEHPSYWAMFEGDPYKNGARASVYEVMSLDREEEGEWAGVRNSILAVTKTGGRGK